MGLQVEDQEQWSQEIRLLTSLDGPVNFMGCVFFEPFERNSDNAGKIEALGFDSADLTVGPSQDTGFSWESLSRMPGLDTHEDSQVVQLVKALTGANATGKVSFGTEAGLFHNGGIPAVVCGPGSIEQAHKPNEFIELAQVGECEQFMRRLFERCWA